MREKDAEAPLLPLSALQHLSYCPRQFALIHQEQSFAENVFTLRGRRVHERVDIEAVRTEDGLRIETSVPLVSRRLDLTGKADLVEYRGDGTPVPVEYKHGRRRDKLHDQLQLAAQAICLEEMTGKPVPEGYLYYHSSRRRHKVAIDDALRTQVEQAVNRAKAILASGRLPPPTEDADRCRHCSLIELCQPGWLASRTSERLRVLARSLYDPEEET